MFRIKIYCFYENLNIFTKQHKKSTIIHDTYKVLKQLRVDWILRRFATLDDS